MTAADPGRLPDGCRPGFSPLQDLARAAADHRVTVRHLGRRWLARLSARDFVHDDRRGALWFRVGPRSPHRKVLVVLRSDDTYAVEVARVVTVDSLPAWCSDGTEGVDAGLDAGQLGEAVERLYRQVTG